MRRWGDRFRGSGQDDEAETTKGADYYVAAELVLRRSTASGAGRAGYPNELDTKARIQKDVSVKPVA